MANCVCEKITGTAVKCVTDLNFASLIGIMQKENSDGNLNSIIIDANITATLNAAVNNTDPTKRFYVIGEFEDSKLTQRESDFDKSASGTKIRKNNFTNMSFMGKLVNMPIQYASDLQNLLSCGEWGVFYIDQLEKIIAGEKKDGLDTFIFPRKINKNSWNARKGDESNGGDYKFVSVEFDESISSTIQSWEVWRLTDFAMEELKPIQKVLAVIGTGATVTEVNISCKFLYSPANEPLFYSNTSPAHWLLDGATGGFSSVIVEANDSLTLTFTTPQTLADVVKIQLAGARCVSDPLTVTIAV